MNLNPRVQSALVACMFCLPETPPDDRGYSAVPPALAYADQDEVPLVNMIVNERETQLMLQVHMLEGKVARLEKERAQLLRLVRDLQKKLE